jgi:preprotein translocase subunit SecY
VNLLEALGQALRIPELRRKLLFTVGLLLAFRAMATVPIPFVNAQGLSSLFGSSSILNLLDLFSGGGLHTFTLVAEGLNPYINATIIMQLMTVVSYRLKELSKEGEQGRQKITRYTRWLTVPLAAFQGFGLVLYFSNSSATQTTGGFLQSTNGHVSLFVYVSVILTLVTGTLIAMWLGELITEYGVGNGVSLIIFAGIIGRLPAAIGNYATTNSKNFIQLVILAFIAVIVTAGVIEVQQGQRRIPIQSAQRVLNARTGLASQRRSNYLPLRVNAAGVIPIIFAISIMYFPTIFANITAASTGWLLSLSQWIQANWQPSGGLWYTELLYNAIYFMLVIGFTYFYTAIQFDPNDVADNLKKQSTFIPGIRPGRSTAEYLGRVMSRITLAGALFLGTITVVLPLATVAIISLATGTSVGQSAPLYLGGTAILIVVSVGLDTMKQIETQLLMRQYRGFIS